ncbi:MAG: GIY-YIG nuclease family protein [Candidatus Sedimenticola sp. (ex Thyasira tokunagai)]
MNESPPFSIRIFVANGDPDGLRIIERSNWSGRAVVFPRSLLPEVKKREEFERTGIYLLLGPSDDGEGETLYIGEGDPVRPRLESHYSQKDFWNRGIFFVTGQAAALNKAHVQYLEARSLTAKEG